jgi:nucleotide-binding universal stress UspA family protein
MRKLLIASDFSEDSAAALRHGAALARICGAEVELYSSYFVGSFALEATELTRSPSFWKQLESDTRARLEQQAAPLRQAGLVVSIAVSAEEPSSAIARRAREVAADLIALGTRGRSGLAHVLLGSVAERVTRIASCPVLTARAQHPGPGAYRRIAVGTDFSLDSEAALLWARELVARTGGELRLLHCVPPPLADRDPLRDDAWMQQQLKQAKGRLVELARPAESEDLLRGHLHVQGLDAVRQMGAELLVVGTRGLTGLAHVVLGSNAERVIRLSPVPVVTVKAHAPDRVP